MPSSRPKVQYRLDQYDKDFIEFYAKEKGFEPAGAFSKVQAKAYMNKYPLRDELINVFKRQRDVNNDKVTTQQDTN